MQGIGCFDGYFRDWIVENNVVITDHWHGISMYGMRGGRIVNNTVIDVNTASPGPPWIMVTAHKDGTPSEDVVVRNNVSTDLSVSGTNVVADHNAEIAMTALGDWFVDPAAFDLHLLPTAAGVNAGSADLAPPFDRDGIPRPQGAAVDLGAYEYHDPSVEPVDGGPWVPPVDAGASEDGPTDGPGDDAGASEDGPTDGPGDDAGAEADAGTGGDAAADAGSGGSLAGGCGCRAAGVAPSLAPLLGAVLLVARRVARGRAR
jgi:hypothetical protein